MSKTKEGITRIILLRHAESANPQVFHGAESDVGLSALGHKQAGLLAEAIVPYRPDFLVSSAMRRARETAEPIARACRLSIRLEPDLHERRVGSLAGTPFSRKEGVWFETLQRWMSGETDYAPPGAESFDTIRDRVMPVWERLAVMGNKKTTVVLAHGVVCKVLLICILPELSLRDWDRIGPIQNTALNELVLSGGTWQAVRINELPEGIRRLPPANGSVA
jgi:probable phosphoglycerate mutase